MGWQDWTQIHAICRKHTSEVTKFMSDGVGGRGSCRWVSWVSIRLHSLRCLPGVLSRHEFGKHQFVSCKILFGIDVVCHIVSMCWAISRCEFVPRFAFVFHLFRCVSWRLSLNSFPKNGRCHAIKLISHPMFPPKYFRMWHVTLRHVTMFAGEIPDVSVC